MRLRDWEREIKKKERERCAKKLEQTAAHLEMQAAMYRPPSVRPDDQLAFACEQAAAVLFSEATDIRAFT